VAGEEGEKRKRKAVRPLEKAKKGREKNGRRKGRKGRAENIEDLAEFGKKASVSLRESFGGGGNSARFCRGNERGEEKNFKNVFY